MSPAAPIVFGLILSCRLTVAQLATTEDGSILYVSMSARRTKSNDGLHPKIYRWTESAGLSVVADFPNPVSEACHSPDFFRYLSPSVSRDGSVLAYTANRHVERSRPCGYGAEADQAVIVRAGRELRLSGRIAISPNGRYAVTSNQAAIQNQFHTVTDLSTGLSTLLVNPFNGDKQTITDEGTVVSTRPSAVVLTDRMGNSKILTTEYEADYAIIDRTGATVVYQTSLEPSGFTGQLSAIDVRTGRETGLDHIGFPSAISVNGSDVFLYSSSSAPIRRQVFVSSLAGGRARRITNEPDAILGAVVSGDGKVLYGFTGDRLIRVATASGEVREIARGIVSFADAFRVLFPTLNSLLDGNRLPNLAPVGSLVEMMGSPRGQVSWATVCGKPAELAPGTRLRLVVPWDAPEGVCEVVAGNDRFEHGALIEVRLLDPKFLSSAFRASPGQVLAIYMSGLGPVDGSGRVAATFSCEVGGVPADIEYAGLAPGIPGFHQVNFRVPLTARGESRLTCGFPDPELRASASIQVVE